MMAASLTSGALSSDLNARDCFLIGEALRAYRTKVAHHNDYIDDYRRGVDVDEDDRDALMRLQHSIHEEWVRIGELMELTASAHRITVQQRPLKIVPALGEAGGGGDRPQPAPSLSATAEGGG